MSFMRFSMFLKVVPGLRGVISMEVLLMGPWVVLSAPCRIPVVLKEDPFSSTLESLIFEGLL